MLDCQKLKETIQNFRERYSFLEGELLKFKETGEMSGETRKKLEKLKKEFDEFEEREVGERVKKLEEGWENVRKGDGIEFPETPYFLLEKVLNKFIEGFKEKEYVGYILGSFISDFINKNIELYIEREEWKGKEIDEIKEVVIRLNVKDLPRSLSNLGSSDREKCHLIIYGDCGDFTAAGMSGGKIEVQGSCRGDTAMDMSGGTLIILGEVKNFVGAFSPQNKGEIWHKGEKIWSK